MVGIGVDVAVGIGVGVGEKRPQPAIDMTSAQNIHNRIGNFRMIDWEDIQKRHEKTKVRCLRGFTPDSPKIDYNVHSVGLQTDCMHTIPKSAKGVFPFRDNFSKAPPEADPGAEVTAWRNKCKTTEIAVLPQS